MRYIRFVVKLKHPILSALETCCAKSVSLVYSAEEKVKYMPKIGFSTGCLFKFLDTKESIKRFKEEGIEAIEIVAYGGITDEWVDKVFDTKLSGFEYVSLHAPNVDYGNDQKTFDLLEKIGEIDKLRKLDLVVFHPDRIIDLSLFEGLDFKVGFENMDSRKELFKTAEELHDLVDQKNFKVVLDLNHAYTNDSSLKTLFNFSRLLKANIVEIHLSGYLTWHDPLFKTRQESIIESVKGFKVPIIIESILRPEDIITERNYILKVLGY